jgi:predicted GNAT family N-acyltransferase
MSNTIRTATALEIDFIMNLAAAEGWNPGLSDGSLFYHADPSGFLVMEEDGQLTGCVSAVRYDQHFGFLGLYIVKPDYRGKGCGIQLWNKALEYLGSRNTGLDGVVEQQDNYKRSGFRFAYNNVRYKYTTHGTEQANLQVSPLSSFGFETVSSFDRRHFPSDRGSFLHAWINQQDAIALGAGTGSDMKGYIVVRKFLEGYKAGPLFATDRHGNSPLAICSLSIAC